jgi:hypothetical protein
MKYSLLYGISGQLKGKYYDLTLSVQGAFFAFSNSNFSFFIALF